MSDLEQIRNTLARYCHLIDDGRFDDWAELFTPDGTFSVLGQTYRGRDEIKGFIGGALTPERRGKHITANSAIEVQGDTARAWSDIIFFSPAGSGLGITAAGRYEDRLVRQDGRWRFAARDVRLLGEQT